MANNPYLDMTLPRGFRNLNPGNIEDGPFARRQPGYSGGDGRFARFDNMENGLNAQSALLQSYGNKGLNTLNAIVNRYAPASDHNNTAAYAGFLSKRLGIAPDAPLDMSNPSVRRDLAMAMAQHENGKDPRGFMALASDSTPQIGGEQPQAPQGTQSISLGDQENQQPFNNIGSTLANMGASLASLDRGGTGIASLNASRVASNLASQEQAREAQGGWKYAGQTQNGQGLMFQNSRGEIRVEPLAPGFSGQKESSTTQFLKEIQSHPELAQTYRDIHGIQDAEQYDPDSLKLAGMDWLSNGNPQALKDVPIKKRPEAMRLAQEQFKKDTGQDYDPADLALRRGDYQVLKSESMKFGQMLAPTQAAHDRLQADIKIAKERVADLPSELNTHNMPWNKFMQSTAEQLQTAGFSKLAQARESIYNVERGYTNVQSNGMRTGDTVAAQKRAEALINSAMTPDVLLGQADKDGKRSGGLLDFMSDSGTRILNSVKGGQDTLRQEWKSRARNFGSGVQKAEDDIVNDIDKRIGKSSSGAGKPTIGGTTKAPANIRNQNDLMSWIQSQGLQKGDKFTLPDGTEGTVP